MTMTMTVEQILQSFPVSRDVGKCIPCDDGEYVILRHIKTKEQLAIYILYEYSQKRIFLPSTVISYCEFPEKSVGPDYDPILSAFLEKQKVDRLMFLNGKLYKCYSDEISTLYEDLREGGNMQVTRDLCLQMWIHYRTMFREAPFSTQAVVEANPVLCRKNSVCYAGPLIF